MNTQIELDEDEEEITRPDIPRLIKKESGEFVIATGKPRLFEELQKINE